MGKIEIPKKVLPNNYRYFPSSAKTAIMIARRSFIS